MVDVAYAGSAPRPGRSGRPREEQDPSLVVSAAHSALGAVTRLQVRVGAVTVLLSPTEAGWERAGVSDELDIAAHLAGRLDLVGRSGSPRRSAGTAGCRSPATRPSGPPTPATPTPWPGRPAARPRWSGRWPGRSR